MKRTKHIALAMTTCVSLLLTGCNNGSTTASSGDDYVESVNSTTYIADDTAVRKTFAEIRDNFEKDVETIKNKEYDNLNFSKAEFFAPPQIDSISELKLVELKGKSTDEIYDFFCKTIDRLSDNKYTDEKKRYEIRFIDAASDESNSFPYNYPNIDEIKSGHENAYQSPYIGDENYYIDMISGVIYGFDNGDMIDYDGVERESTNFQLYHMLNDVHRHILYTEDLTSAATYKLVDGEISIADAAKFAQKYIDEFDYTPYDDAILPKPVIYAVNVFDIGGGNYGYSFMITYEYNGIWFDRYETKIGARGYQCVSTDYDKQDYDSWMGCIEMIRTDKIHSFRDISMIYGVEEGEPATEIITVDSAADAVSEFFSGFMKFTITDVSMVWLRTRAYETDAEGFPCWKFKMYADGEIYHTFVDVITGEIHLYIQVP